MSLKELKESKMMADEAQAKIEEIMETLSHYDLAEMYVELLDIAKTLERQIERIYTYAKTLEFEVKSLKRCLK